MATSLNKCTGCGDRFPPGDLISVPAGKFHSWECATQYATDKKNKPKIKKIADKVARKDLRERKEKLKPLKWFSDRAQSEFNKFIRLRDKGLPCISCGKPDSGDHQRHASHYRSRGGCSFLRFDENNVHASCSQCNNHMSGNIINYTPELIKKVGENEFDRIQNAPKSYKWSRDELIEIYEKYKGKCRELETESA